MSVRRRTARASVVAGAVATATVLMASGAAAVDPPSWKRGYVPHGEGCDAFAAGSVATVIPTPEGWVYIDTQKPRLSAKPHVVRLGNTPKAATLWTVRAQQTCSGVVGVAALVDRGDGTSHYWELPAQPQDGDYFDVSFDLRSDNSDEPGRKLDHGDLGAYPLNSATTVKRWSMFLLNRDRTEAEGSDPLDLGSMFAGISGDGLPPAYVLRDTQVAATSASRTTVRKPRKGKKAKKVSFWTTFRVANGSAYVPLAGQTVRLERRVTGTSRWTTVATSRTASDGSVRFTQRPRRSAAYRVVNPGTFAAPWTAPTTAGEVTVKVKKPKVTKKAKKAKKAEKGAAKRP